MLCFPELFVSISRQPTPAKRMLFSSLFFVSTFKNLLRPSKRKPLNPLIGEFLSLDVPVSSDSYSPDLSSQPSQDGTSIHFVTEQTSHHPPANVWNYSHEPSGSEYNGTTCVKVGFDGLAIQLKASGHQTITLKNLNERYLCDPNSLNVFLRGVLTGRTFMDVVGKMNVVCPDTGFVAQLEFLEKPWFSGEYRQFRATVFDREKRVVERVKGNWGEKLYAKEGGEEKEGETEDGWTCIFDMNRPTVDPEKIYLSTLNSTHSSDMSTQALWAGICREMKSENFDEAAKRKTSLENKQRKYHKEIEQGQRPPHRSVWFEQQDGFVFTEQDILFLKKHDVFNFNDKKTEEWMKVYKAKKQPPSLKEREGWLDKV
eukprot:Lithocolla_globosa_v1_NODE_2284_length_2068_cov_7.526080.p1 type:complete len:371 gc:universal NODE_2284_length_2068_cov_7.526080:1390-278(-)